MPSSSSSTRRCTPHRQLLRHAAPYTATAPRCSSRPRQSTPHHSAAPPRRPCAPPRTPSPPYAAVESASTTPSNRAARSEDVRWTLALQHRAQPRTAPSCPARGHLFPSFTPLWPSVPSPGGARRRAPPWPPRSPSQPHKPSGMHSSESCSPISPFLCQLLLSPSPLATPPPPSFSEQASPGESR